MAWRQFCSCLAYFVFGSYSMAVSGDITDQLYFRHYCVDGRKGPAPLPDIMTRLSRPFVSYLRTNKINQAAVVDIILFSLPALLLLQLFTNALLAGKRQLILSRLFVIWGSCCYLRAICLTTTILPSYEGDICLELFGRQAMYETTSVFWSGFLHLAGPITQFYPRADYMFSGHAAAATCMMMFLLYETFDPRWLYRTKRVVIIFAYLTTLFAICLTRSHYTADVLIGIIISVFCYLTYYLIVEKSKRKVVVFPRNIIKWIESQDLHLE